MELEVHVPTADNRFGLAVKRPWCCRDAYEQQAQAVIDRGRGRPPIFRSPGWSVSGLSRGVSSKSADANDTFGMAYFRLRAV
jgi:hypothetical protein